jgi:predicted ester cyclase
MREMTDAIRTPKDTATLFSQAWNLGNFEIIETLLHPDFIHHSGRMGDMDAKQYIEYLKKAKSAFPGGKYFIDDMIGPEDTLGIRHTFEGTMEGPFFSIEPTGKSATQTVNEFAKFKDGQYLENWVILNGFYLVQQLGIKP